MNAPKKIESARRRGFWASMKSISLLLLLLMLCQCLFSLPAFAGDGKGNTEPEELHTESPLYGKTALFCGDSICAAAVYDYSNMTRWGWAGRIGRDYGVKWENLGRDGASVSTVQGSNTVFAQLQGATGVHYDFIILHGGTNDGWFEAPVGEVTAEDNRRQFDDSTFAGGLEKLFAYAKRVYPRSTIGYIINFQTPSSIGNLSDMSAYYDAAKKVCEKWEIPYLDLYNDEEFNGKVMQVKTGRFTADKIHPNGKGYDRIYPYVAAFMEEIAVEAEQKADSDVTSEVASEVASEISSEGSSEAISEASGAGASSMPPFVLPLVIAGGVVVIAVIVLVLVLKKKR